MFDEVEAIAIGKSRELIWILQHKACYTVGAGISKAHPPGLNFKDIPVVKVERGGKITFHGPGQCVIYSMINLVERGLSVSDYLKLFENWLITALAYQGLQAFSGDSEHRGIWVTSGERDLKVASVGIRVRRGVSLYGMALNVAPDMRYFQAIQPCGLNPDLSTSLKNLGVYLSVDEVVACLKITCPWTPLEVNLDTSLKLETQKNKKKRTVKLAAT